MNTQTLVSLLQQIVAPLGEGYTVEIVADNTENSSCVIRHVDGYASIVWAHGDKLMIAPAAWEGDLVDPDVCEHARDFIAQDIQSQRAFGIVRDGQPPMIAQQKMISDQASS